MFVHVCMCVNFAYAKPMLRDKTHNFHTESNRII